MHSKLQFFISNLIEVLSTPGCLGRLCLQRVQNAAARLVARKGPRDHTTPVLHSLHWLPVDYRIKFKLCLLMHLVHIGRSPSYLKEIVQLTVGLQNRRRLRSADSQRYELSKLDLKFGERAFSYAGPAAWNNLPPSLHLLSTTGLRFFRSVDIMARHQPCIV